MEGLVSFEVMVRETDLHILATKEMCDEAVHIVQQYRNQLENYIAASPNFLHALTPVPVDKLAPRIVQEMISAGQSAGVGPMAAVAGTLAELVGKDLLQKTGIDEVMVENGGDIYLRRKKSCIISIYAGSSPLSNKVGIKIPAEKMPLGICTSSATIGHSLSLGSTDAVTVLSASTALADAFATRIGNETKEDDDINSALKFAETINGITGVVIIKGGMLGAWGDIELVRL